MSSIKLKHSGGNSVSITGPATNPVSDRTLTLPSDADGTIITDVTRKGFLARQSASNNIPNNTFTKVTNLNTQLIEQNIGTSYANNRFTIATGQEGVYFVYGGVAIDDVQILDHVQIKFYVNGNAQILFHTEEQRFQNGSTPNLIIQTGLFGYMINLSVGDYVEMFCKHNEGSTEPTEPNRTWFGAFRI